MQNVQVLLHPTLTLTHAAYADSEAADPLEAKAKERDLNYVKLDGEVGIIGNGAGLVMSTLDVVAYAGEAFGGVKPANFLDIGGGASAEVMANGLEIVLSDPAVRSVFVNVFGGITACDAVANGIVSAVALLKERGEAVDRPIVVRLDGNKAAEGRQILQDAAQAHEVRAHRDGVLIASFLGARCTRGLTLFVSGAYALYEVRPTIQNRVDAWQHPFVTDLYDKAGGSFQVAQSLFAQADGLLAVGCRFTQAATGSWALRPPPLLHIDIDAEEIGRHYPVKQGVVADAATALSVLLVALPETPRPPWTPARPGRTSSGRSPWCMRGRRSYSM